MKKGSILVSTSVLLGTVVVLSLMLISLNFFIYNRLNKDLSKERSLLEIQVAAQEIISQINYDLTEDQIINHESVTYEEAEEVYSFILESDLYKITVWIDFNKMIKLWKVEARN
jgi:cell division protein YceG involved in septum cleavage